MKTPVNKAARRQDARRGGLTEPQMDRLQKAAANGGEFVVSRTRAIQVCKRLVERGLLELRDYHVGPFRERWTYCITDAGRSLTTGERRDG